MENKASNINVRINTEIKEQVDQILEGLGLNASVAINMLYKQIIYCRGLPFDVKLPEEKADSNHQDESKMVQAESNTEIKKNDFKEEKHSAPIEEVDFADDFASDYESEFASDLYTDTEI